MTNSDPPSQPYALRPPEAARHVGVSRTTLWRWVQAGRVKPCVIEGVTLFVREELEKAVNNGNDDSGNGQSGNATVLQVRRDICDARHDEANPA